MNEHESNRRLRDIRDALDINTVGMSESEVEQVWKLASELSTRATCEWWGVKHGWTIPRHGTPEWEAMQEAWLKSPDEDVDGQPEQAAVETGAVA